MRENFDTFDMKKSADDLFINKLMEETYRFIPDNDSSKDPQDLWDYFQRQNNKDFSTGDQDFDAFCAKFQFISIPITFIPSLSCFRITIDGNNLDLPRNWSFFKQLYVSYKNGLDDLLHINQHNDYDHFLSIFPGMAQGVKGEITVVHYQQKIFLIVIPPGRESAVQEIKNYFQLEETPLLRAA